LKILPDNPGIATNFAEAMGYSFGGGVAVVRKAENRCFSLLTWCAVGIVVSPNT